MSSVDLDMPINAVDETDQILGVVPRRDVFEVRANFRVVHVLIFNSNGDLLIQQLAESRERNPGSWGSSVAGYLFASESYYQAAVRRVKEELGATLPELNYLGKTTMMDNGCEKFISVFRGIHDGPFAFDQTVIASLRFEAIGRIKMQLQTSPALFTPTFHQVLNFVERGLIE